jgi:hypothetical protein
VTPRRGARGVRYLLAASGLVGVPALFAVSPLRNAATGAPVAASLHLPAGYLLLAPLSDLFDEISLLSVRQHVALGVTILVAYVGVRWWRRRRDPRPPVWAEFGGGATLAALVFALYAGVTRAPRPMASLVVDSAEQVVVDFHSHTNASHDARRDFTLARNRDWHRDAGFDVAFVTDHVQPDADAHRSPRTVGASGLPVLLFGAERACHGAHLLLLGAGARGAAPDCGDAAEPELDWWEEAPGPSIAPVTILTLPEGRLARSARGGVQGMELVDAAPRGLAQLDRDRAAILRAAERDRLVLLAGSNNHGWGRTAAAWSVMTIAGWRSMTPVALESAILGRLVTRSPDAVEVVERRRVAAGESALMLGLTVPALATNTLLTMSPAERVSWLVWMWAVFAVPWLVRQARRLLSLVGRRQVRLVPRWRQAPSGAHFSDNA